MFCARFIQLLVLQYIQLRDDEIAFQYSELRVNWSSKIYVDISPSYSFSWFRTKSWLNPTQNILYYAAYLSFVIIFRTHCQQIQNIIKKADQNTSLEF